MDLTSIPTPNTITWGWRITGKTSYRHSSGIISPFLSVQEGGTTAISVVPLQFSIAQIAMLTCQACNSDSFK